MHCRIDTRATNRHRRHGHCTRVEQTTMDITQNSSSWFGYGFENTWISNFTCGSISMDDQTVDHWDEILHFDDGFDDDVLPEM